MTREILELIIVSLLVVLFFAGLVWYITIHVYQLKIRSLDVAKKTKKIKKEKEKPVVVTSGEGKPPGNSSGG